MMTFRQQQLAVFFGTVVLIFGLFAGGLFLISQRLIQEATLQSINPVAKRDPIGIGKSPARGRHSPMPGQQFAVR